MSTDFTKCIEDLAREYDRSRLIKGIVQPFISAKLLIDRTS